MDTYTIEDVELLRKKGGMTYQEAVALLEYHNGNLARALIDLEKNGRLKDERSTAKAAPAAENASRKHGETREKALNLLQKLYRCRVKVHKGDVPVINVSVLYAAACLLFAPHITVAGFIIAMILGYRFSFSQMDADFATDNLKTMVKNAAENARASVNSVVKTFSGETEKKEVPTIQVPVQTETRDGKVQIDDETDGYSSVTIE